LTTPSLQVSSKIADYFGVALDELVGMNTDKSHITVLRFRQAQKRLGPKEFEKAWIVGKKVWDLIRIDDDAARNENIQLINAIVNLLNEIRNGGRKKPVDVPSLFKIH